LGAEAARIAGQTAGPIADRQIEWNAHDRHTTPRRILRIAPPEQAERTGEGILHPDAERTGGGKARSIIQSSPSGSSPSGYIISFCTYSDGSLKDIEISRRSGGSRMISGGENTHMLISGRTIRSPFFSHFASTRQPGVNCHRLAPDMPAPPLDATDQPMPRVSPGSNFAISRSRAWWRHRADMLGAGTAFEDIDVPSSAPRRSRPDGPNRYTRSRT
jgi:hypothetical protein